MATLQQSVLMDGNSIALLRALGRRQKPFGIPRDMLLLSVSANAQIFAFIDNGNKIVVRDRSGKEHPWSPYQPFIAFELPVLDSQFETERQTEAAKSVVLKPEAIDKIRVIKSKDPSVCNRPKLIPLYLKRQEELVRIMMAGAEIVIQRPDGKEFTFDPENPYARPPLRAIPPRREAAPSG